MATVLAIGHRILLRGRPGIGKTTIVRRVVDELVGRDLAVAGFLTAEIREGGTRSGFEVAAISGATARLAHVSFPGPPRVGRYGVDLDAFEQVALPSIAPPFQGVVVIDELGPMELASDPLISAVVGLFEAEEVPVLATVHARRHPFTDLLIGRNDTELVEVTIQNRDVLPAHVFEALTSDS